MAKAVSEPVVVDDPERGRFEIRLPGALAGFTEYLRQPGLITFMHTQINERYEGRGLGGRLIEGALDSAREQGLAVLPLCPFVRGYIDGHREYLDLVPLSERERSGLPADA